MGSCPTQRSDLAIETLSLQLLFKRIVESAKERKTVIMIVGNPYTFAILAEVVDEWNPEGTTFHLGLLYYCVDGVLFPSDVRTATLKAEIRPVKELLMHPAVDVKLFIMGKEEAFMKSDRYTVSLKCLHSQ